MCGKPYNQNSNYAEVCEDFEKRKMTNFENLSDIRKLANFFLVLLIVRLVPSIVSVSQSLQQKTVKTYTQNG